jgi:hypothetical protein
MPTFNLRIRFTGICTFVPNSEEGKTKMCVVFPDGTGTKQKVATALDGSDLKRHVGYISFNLHDVKGANWALEDAKVLWYLSGQRLVIKTEGAENEYDDSDLRYIAELEEVVPDLANVYPEFLSEKPNATYPKSVLAQFLIDAGTLTTGTEDTTRLWAFPNTISKKEIKEVHLKHEVSLEFKGLTGASLWATAFEGGTSKGWHFEGEQDKWVDIVIANLCDENPLRWITDQSILPPDEDFKWHYRLLDKAQEIKRELKSLDLPIPYMFKDSVNGQGVNCPPSKASESPLTSLGLDSFLDEVVKS